MRREGIAIALAAGVLAGCWSDEFEEHYKTLAAAQLAGAVDRGWIPQWLPKNANTIKEKHNLDTKRSLLRFAFPESDKWAPPDSCRQVNISEARAPAMSAAWWPGDVPSTIITPRYSFYACAEGLEFLAVDFKRGEALHWRP